MCVSVCACACVCVLKIMHTVCTRLPEIMLASDGDGLTSCSSDDLTCRSPLIGDKQQASFN